MSIKILPTILKAKILCNPVHNLGLPYVYYDSGSPLHTEMFIIVILATFYSFVFLSHASVVNIKYLGHVIT